MKVSSFTLFLLAICLHAFSQTTRSGTDSCHTDSIIINTNADWLLMNNSVGATMNSPAIVTTYQYNSLPTFPLAKWISFQTAWTVTTSTSLPDDSMTFRYYFNNCNADTINFDFTFRRDNYCSISLDNTYNLWHDSAVWDYDFYDFGDQIQKSYYLLPCEHFIDYTVYNRNSFSGTNGFGGILGGIISSNNKTLLIKDSKCDSVACCVPSSINNIKKDEFVIYPNPASTYLNIKIPALNTPIEIYMMNVLAQTVYTGMLKNKETEISLEKFASGIYFISLGKENRKTIKFVKS